MDGRRFTVAEYHRMIDLGVLTENDKVDLLEGLVVAQERRSPPHEFSRHATFDSLLALLPSESWQLRNRGGVTLSESELDPDMSVVRRNEQHYTTRHPNAADFGIIIEVADTSLATDRTIRLRIYARDGIPVYWIVNLVDRQIEVHEQPSGASPSPTYGTRRTFQSGDAVPVVLDGITVGTIPVVDLLP